DGWLTGYSTKYATAVWVAYHNRTREMSGFMENMTRPIWLGFMERAHQGKEAKPFVKPAGVKMAPAYVIRSHVGTGSVEPSPSNDLYPSWYQNKGDNNERRVIDIVSGKLATECTPELAKRTETGGSASEFSGDTFNGGSTNTSNETDDVHKCTDERPSVSVSVSGSDGKYTLRASASPGTHPLSSGSRAGVVNFKVNGQTVSGGSVGISQAQSGITYRPSQNGNAQVTAEIIDSVLYSSTSNPVRVNFIAGGSNLILSFSEKGQFIDFDWTDNNGKVTIYKKNGDKVCEGDNDCSNVLKVTIEGAAVYARDNETISNEVTIDN
ncbi:MAG: hypothetical protein M3Q14_02640, partial [bacterium]|nr:hypothetical protein [bacterium]